MWSNYLKTALRSLRKQKLFAAINVGGLALGVACFALLVLLVRHEWSFDRFHEASNRIHRIYVEWVGPDGDLNYQTMMPPPFTPRLEEEFGGIEAATRMVRGDQDLQVGPEFFRRRLIEVDPAFFRLFSFEALAGRPAEGIEDPGGMVLTRSAAASMLGVPEDAPTGAIDRTVSITRGDRTFDFRVAAVVADPPSTSSIEFEAAISFENYDEIYLGGNNWGGRTSTYLLLAPDQDPATLERALQPFVETQAAPYIEALREADLLAAGENAFRTRLQPLHRLHLEPAVVTPYETTPHDPIYSIVLIGIGVLVLVIACINFVTLSVGRSTERALEVGVRKTLGASRGQVTRQFWGETLLLTTAALIGGLVLAGLLLPFFEDLVGRELSVRALSGPEIVLFLGALILLVGAAAGGYPAMVLARFTPATVLRGRAARGGNSPFTRGLVVLQYTIAIGLIVATVISARQLDFLMSKDLGYNEDLVMVVHTHQVSRREAPNVLARFRNELLPRPEIVEVARAGYSFTRGSDRNTWGDASGVTRSAYNFGVDPQWIELLGLEIVAGRSFSAERPSDSTASVLVNEALVREFRLEEPIGHRLVGWLDDIYEEPPAIVGVVEDFHFKSLRQEVQPAVLNMHPDYYNYMGAMLVRVSPGDVSRAIELVESQWAATLPNRPFTYSFLEEDLARQYLTEQRWSRIITYAAGLAVLIACLGLFALATLAVSRRTREIGIRKVLGATIPGIASLIAREFATLVALAMVVAWPLAYLGLSRWLSGFAYHVDLGTAPFVLTGVGTLAVALLTVSFHAIRAALTDPVEAIAYE